MGRTALVTGGTGGIGSAVTRRFLDEGWRVVVPWVDERELGRLEPADRLTLVRADLFDETSVARCVESASGADDAPLAAVVNLVGGFAMGGRVHETPVAEFEDQLRLNLRPTYLVCRQAIPHLLDRGSGAIACVSSRAAVKPFPGAAGYITGKAAVLALVDSLAVEYGDAGVRTNAVLPSVVDTPANRAAQPAADHSRWVTPDQVAAVVHFLCDDAASVINGAHVPVYGRA